MTQTVQQAGVNPTASDAVEVARNLDVDPAQGLTAGEAAARLASHGPNRLAAGKKEPAWRAFVRPVRDFMQVVLLGAAFVNQMVTGETGDHRCVAGLTVFNAVLGLNQESKAEESVMALAQMLKTVARVRRDGQAVEVDRVTLCPVTWCWSRPATWFQPTGGSASPRRWRLTKLRSPAKACPYSRRRTLLRGRMWR